MPGCRSQCAPNARYTTPSRSSNPGRLSCHCETNPTLAAPSFASDTPGHDAHISTGLFGWSVPLVMSRAYRYWWNEPSARRLVLATTYSVAVESAMTGVLVIPITGATLVQPSMSSLDTGASSDGIRLLVHN